VTVERGGERLLGRVGMVDLDAPEHAGLVDQVDHADVGDAVGDEPRHAPERRLVVQRADQQRAGVAE
jgi:hypothetical protein